jgi:hypothetical protein
MPEFQHTPHSEIVCIPGENPKSLDALIADLRAEHQPTTPTEELLVDEMAQNYWRMKRYRQLEASMWMSDERSPDGKLTANLDLVQWTVSSGIATHYQRAMTSAERAFYRALTALRGLQKQRGFVFSTSPEQPAEPVSSTSHSTKARAAGSVEVGFVFSSEPSSAQATPSGFVPANPAIPAKLEPVTGSGFVFANPACAEAAASQSNGEVGFVFANSAPAVEETAAGDRQNQLNLSPQST